MSGSSMKAPVAAAAVLLLLLPAGCRTSRPDLPVERARREQAVEAADDFVAALNRGACQSIYDEASSVFREMEPAGEWVRECRQMRSLLGSWRGICIGQVTAGGAGVTVLRGSVQFERGTYRLQMDCLEERGRARFLLVELDGDTGGFFVPRPRFPSFDRQDADPPDRFGPNHG